MSTHDDMWSVPDFHQRTKLLDELANEYTGELCQEDRGLHCTRPANHPGRHIATGGPDGPIYAAWPGTHTPTADDLQDPS